MTGSAPLDRVIRLLVENEYRKVTTPLLVASVPFQFSAVFVGTGRAADLIVVLDTVEEKESEVQRKIEGLSRALDVARSRRPLTSILVGPKPQTPTLDAVGRVSRVLLVGTPLGDSAEQSVEESLAVLLPLQLPDPTETVADSSAELAHHLPTNIDADVLASIMAEGSRGAENIEQVLRRLLAEPFAEVDEVSAE